MPCVFKGDPILTLYYRHIIINTDNIASLVAKDGPVCKYDPANLGAKITGCVDVKHQDEMALQEAVQKIGPISVAIDAGHKSFQLYHSGKFHNQNKTLTCYLTRNLSALSI